MIPKEKLKESPRNYNKCVCGNWKFVTSKRCQDCFKKKSKSQLSRLHKK